MVIYIIRHGETDWNTKRLLQGATDIPLNENGIEVARLTAKGLEDVDFDLIFTSPLKRAKETAEIIRGNRKIPLVEEERLREVSFGPFEGLCCKKENWNIPDPKFVYFFTNPGEYTPPEGGESIRHLCERATEFLQELLHNPDYQDKTILLSGHGAVVKALLSSITITDLKDFWNGGVHKNCGVTILDVEQGKITLRQENVIYYDEARSSNYFE
ncbi:MAG: histidine phosphatase family protein [Lachnospiraceae bacterium]|nr:histidine phosphatase family protein [Lachnospiraceae bacterium]